MFASVVMNENSPSPVGLELSAYITFATVRYLLLTLTLLTSTIYVEQESHLLFHYLYDLEWHFKVIPLQLCSITPQINSLLTYRFPSLAIVYDVVEKNIDSSSKSKSNPLRRRRKKIRSVDVKTAEKSTNI